MPVSLWRTAGRPREKTENGPGLNLRRLEGNGECPPGLAYFGGVDPRTITLLLERAAREDAVAVNAVFDLVHGELHRIARAQMAGERANHTLTPTALVNEAYVKLVEHTPGRVEDRRHFLSIAARAMRQVLVDHAERRNAAKRGGGAELVTFHDSAGGLAARTDDVLALDQALSRLEAFDPRLARIVEYRFFAGMTQEEIAALMQLSVRTVKRDWRVARAWLRDHLTTPPPTPQR